MLTRATTDLRAYERALEERGIPTYVIGGRGYWSHPQVVDLVAYLRALANPRDEEALYTVLASPLVGGVGRRAGDCRRGGALERPGPLVGAARARRPARRAGGRGCREAGASSRAGSPASARRPRAAAIEQLIDRVMALTGYDLAVLAMPGGQRAAGQRPQADAAGPRARGAEGGELRGFLDSRSRPASGAGRGRTRARRQSRGRRWMPCG